MRLIEDARYRLEPLGKEHDREAFTCGVESLDAYLKTQASQDMRRKANAVFVLVPEESASLIAGYFTLCAYAVAPGSIPEAARKHLPRYPAVSATLIGRLAVSKEFQGRGVGSMLLARALRKACENAAVVCSSMVVVDAIDERAAGFYQAHGFIRLPDSMRLILPMRTITGLLAG
jgi:ribosomal protein S18 acetylase RimI-like enzyme